MWPLCCLTVWPVGPLVVLKVSEQLKASENPITLPTGSIFGHLATGGVVEPLPYDVCTVVIP